MEVILLGGKDGQEPEHHLPLQMELDLVSVPIQMSPGPHGPHLCMPALQGGGNVQRGKCKMQETTPAFIFTPGRARSPCAVLWGSTVRGFSGFKVLEKIIPEVKQHESRQEICPSPF